MTSTCERDRDRRWLVAVFRELLGPEQPRPERVEALRRGELPEEDVGGGEGA